MALPHRKISKLWLACWIIHCFHRFNPCFCHIVQARFRASARNISIHRDLLYVCFFLQGVVSIFLVRTMADDFLTRLISAAFFITSPIFIRTGHPALCSHWIIIAALWLYFRKEPYSLKSLRNWTMLAAISATIHPYITAMTMGLAAAFYLRVWLVDKKISLKMLVMNFFRNPVQRFYPVVDYRIF